MPGILSEEEVETLPIDGELLDERDLIDADAPDFNLPDGIDQGWLLGELYKDLYRGEQAKAVLAEAQMRKVIELSNQVEHRTVEGLGATVARIPLDVYLHWVAREGTDFWLQRDTLDFFEKRAGGGRGNPGFRIKSSTGRTVVTVDHDLPRGDAPAAGVKGKRPAGGPSSDSPAASAAQAPKRARGGRWHN